MKPAQPWKEAAKGILVTLYFANTRRNLQDGIDTGTSIAYTNWINKINAWFRKRRLVRIDSEGWTITAKGRRYVEKRGLLNNPRYPRFEGG